MTTFTQPEPVVRSGSRAASSPPSAPPPQRGVVLVGIAAATGLLALTLGTQGMPQAGLLLLGLGLGFALFHSRFGFTSAWRQLVAVGQGKALRAHTLLLAVTAVLFAPFLAAGVSPTGDVAGYVAPISVGVLLGATVFGVGMQIGGACASGTLYAVGSGHTSILLTLGGFVVAATIGAAHLGAWEAVPAIGPVSLADVSGGTVGGLAVTLAALAGITATTVIIGRRRNPPPVEPIPTSKAAARLLRGAWPRAAGHLARAAAASVRRSPRPRAADGVC